MKDCFNQLIKFPHHHPFITMGLQDEFHEMFGTSATLSCSNSAPGASKKAARPNAGGGAAGDRFRSRAAARVDFYVSTSCRCSSLTPFCMVWEMEDWKGLLKGRMRWRLPISRPQTANLPPVAAVRHPSLLFNLTAIRRAFPSSRPFGNLCLKPSCEKLSLSIIKPSPE